jgi:hypothetical protein
MEKNQRRKKALFKQGMKKQHRKRSIILQKSLTDLPALDSQQSCQSFTSFEKGKYSNLNRRLLKIHFSSKNEAVFF